MSLPAPRTDEWLASASRDDLVAELARLHATAAAVREAHARHWRDLTARQEREAPLDGRLALAAAFRSAKGPVHSQWQPFDVLAPDDLAREDALETANRAFAWLSHHGWTLTRIRDRDRRF